MGERKRWRRERRESKRRERSERKRREREGGEREGKEEKEKGERKRTIQFPFFNYHPIYLFLLFLPSYDLKTLKIIIEHTSHTITHHTQPLGHFFALLYVFFP